MGAVRQAGFTLIEILVVLVIIGIMVSQVGVRMMPDDDRVLRTEAERLSLLLEQAHDQAVASGTPVGWSVEQGTYRFWSLDADGKWAPLAADDVLRDRVLPAGVRLAELESGQARLAAGERLVFLPTGTSTPFTADLYLNAAHARIEGDRLGRVRLAMAQGAVE